MIWCTYPSRAELNKIKGNFTLSTYIIWLQLKILVEEVSKKKIPITYNIFFYDTSSTSVIKEEGPV